MILQRAATDAEKMRAFLVNAWVFDILCNVTAVFYFFYLNVTK